MTFDEEIHRLGWARQPLPGPAEELAEVRDRTRAQIIDRWLPQIVDEVLASSEIAAGVSQASLDQTALRRQVLDAGNEVLAPASALLDQAVDAAAHPKSITTTEERRPEPVFGLVMMLLGCIGQLGALGLVVFAFVSWPLWGVVLSFSIASVAAVLSFEILLNGQERYRGAPRRTTVSADAALAIWLRACRDDGVLPHVRRIINEHLAPIERFLLSVTSKDAPGLRGASESPYVVETTSVVAFRQAADRLRTGAIGIAGPRGVGKTSLIEHFAGRAGDDDFARRRLQVTVSAPVQYEPRDFVLHLFAAVCQAVLRERGADRNRFDQFQVFGRLLRFAVLVGASVGAMVLVLGMDVFAQPEQLLDAVRQPNLWLLPAAVLTVLVVVEAAGWTTRMIIKLLRRRADDRGVVGVARRHLENIHYLRTHTSGWSGKLTLPIKSEAGWSRQTQRQQRPQTYPELVTALRDFLATFAVHQDTEQAMIIAIDELDKMESADQAQHFLNEIKGIFGAPGTQFLVAVSEDALALFERRGVPLRDAFDSAFHDIVHVDYLTLTDTSALLRTRVLLLPEPFIWLAHCLSGGLPRDVVRTARAMVALPVPGEASPTIDQVCCALVADDLARKSHAFQLACRDIGDSPEVTEFIRSLRRLQEDADTLLGLIPMLRQDGELATLSRQAAAYMYYSATLLEVFRRDRVESGDKATFDLLARAKQSLAVHPRLAWLQVDEFREAWRLATVSVD